MASDEKSVSTVASNISYVVRQQIDHCWMVQTPCDEGFIDRNVVSASIGVKAKEVWGITVDVFAHFLGSKF